MPTQSNIQTDGRLALIVISIQETSKGEDSLAYEFKIMASGEKELSPFGGKLVEALSLGIKASVDLIMNGLNGSDIFSVTDDNDPLTPQQ